MKILVAGDIHMDTSHVEYLIRQAAKNECKIILQVGDFGYWPHTQNGQNYLRKVERMLNDADITLYWIDGNHENFDALDTTKRDNIYSPIVMADNTWKITNRIYYIPRGYAWEWDGVKFLAMGGAASIDRGWRIDAEKDSGKPGTLYWPQEKITQEDIDRAVDNARVIVDEDNGIDILVLHDAPLYVNIPLETWDIDGALKTDIDVNRRYLNSLVERLDAFGIAPKLMFHGHYHRRHSIPYARPGLTIPCEGLDMNGTLESSYYILNTEDLPPPYYGTDIKHIDETTELKPL